MKKLVLLMSCQILLLVALDSQAASVSVGAAPKGNAKKVAERIIKYNFPKCKSVTKASRLDDGSIRGTCDGIEYRVFTMYSAEEGKVTELALNCKEAKQLLGVDCF